jgi:hypothetical protein
MLYTRILEVLTLMLGQYFDILTGFSRGSSQALQANSGIGP